MKKKYSRLIVFFLAVFAFSFSFFPLAAQDTGGGIVPPAGKPFVVVIDPGHGGVDPGARGKYSTEKQIALAVGLKLGKLIDQIPNVKVVYTRTTDMLPGGGTNVKKALYYRADLANKIGGNVFISIHCNSAPSITHRTFEGYRTVYRRVHGKKVKRRVRHYSYYRTPNPAKGTEVYVWGVNKNDDKGVALRENAPLLNDPEYKSLFDSTGAAVNAIFWNTVRHEYMRQSLTLAADVESQFAKINRIDREVKQRGVGIWVLHATAMPSILIETGFISNPEEEDYLNHHQDEIAECIYKAFVNYLVGVRGENTDRILAGTQAAAAPAANKDYTYKIQLLVSGNKYDPDDKLFSKLDDKISREKTKSDGSTVYRYLLGDYKTSDEASQKLDRIKLMGYKDAFIVPYDDGQRVDQ
jgi:N-acetylmuramoyl-L-alanine amidase